MAFKKQAISFVVSQIGFVERGVIKVKLNSFHFAPVLRKNDLLHTCADVENNRSFIESQTLSDRFLRSTEVKAVFLKFTLGNICKWFGQLFIVYILSTCMYVTSDIRLNDKIFFAFALESTVIWRLKSNRFHSNTSQISFAERRVI